MSEAGPIVRCIVYNIDSKYVRTEKDVYLFVTILGVCLCVKYALCIPSSSVAHTITPRLTPPLISEHVSYFLHNFIPEEFFYIFSVVTI